MSGDGAHTPHRGVGGGGITYDLTRTDRRTVDDGRVDGTEIELAAEQDPGSRRHVAVVTGVTVGVLALLAACWC